MPKLRTSERRRRRRGRRSSKTRRKYRKRKQRGGITCPPPKLPREYDKYGDDVAEKGKANWRTTVCDDNPLIERCCPPNNSCTDGQCVPHPISPKARLARAKAQQKARQKARTRARVAQLRSQAGGRRRHTRRNNSKRRRRARKTIRSKRRGGMRLWGRRKKVAPVGIVQAYVAEAATEGGERWVLEMGDGDAALGRERALNYWMNAQANREEVRRRFPPLARELETAALRRRFGRLAPVAATVLARDRGIPRPAVPPDVAEAQREAAMQQPRPQPR